MSKLLPCPFCGSGAKPSWSLEYGDCARCGNHDCHAANFKDPVMADEWNRRQADQRATESRAVRKALGFEVDADDVSPRDLVDAIDRRDAEKECYGMQEALEALEYMDREVGSDRGALDATRDELRARVADYRRQAEQAGMNGGET